MTKPYIDSGSRETKDTLRAKLLDSERERLQLAERVARLEQRFTTKHGYDDPEPSQPLDGVPRNARGEVIVPDTLQSRDERIAARKAAQEAEAKAEEEFRTQGLPIHLFRDPTGLIRRKDTGAIAKAEDMAPVTNGVDSRPRTKGQAAAELERRAMNKSRATAKVTERIEIVDDGVFAESNYDPLERS